jgi:predicted DsbA family dithiol-disulfide isomerase
MLIDVYADVVCPWCCIGERRLEKALDKRLDRDANPLRAYRADPLQRRGGSKKAPRRERSPQSRAGGREGQGVLEEVVRGIIAIESRRAVMES